jgi:hypothetical protein
MIMSGRFWAVVFAFALRSLAFLGKGWNWITTIGRVFTLGKSSSGIGIGIGRRFLRCGCLHEACVLSFVPLPFLCSGFGNLTILNVAYKCWCLVVCLVAIFSRKNLMRKVSCTRSSFSTIVSVKLPVRFMPGMVVDYRSGLKENSFMCLVVYTDFLCAIMCFISLAIENASRLPP